MPLVRIVLVVLLLAPVVSVAGSTGASAEVYCRTYVWHVGNRTCWRRVCWRAPEPAYTYRPQPAPYWSEPPTAPSWNSDSDDEDETSSTPAEQDWQPSEPPSRRVVDHLPSLPRIPPALIAIVVMVAGGILLGRLIDHFKAVIAQRQIDRIDRQSFSAHALKRRLDKDARDADALIAAYARQAYRRGRLF